MKKMRQSTKAISFYFSRLKKSFIAFSLRCKNQAQVSREAPRDIPRKLLKVLEVLRGLRVFGDGVFCLAVDVEPCS